MSQSSQGVTLVRGSQKGDELDERETGIRTRTYIWGGCDLGCLGSASQHIWGECAAPTRHVLKLPTPPDHA